VHLLQRRQPEMVRLHSTANRAEAARVSIDQGYVRSRPCIHDPWRMEMDGSWRPVLPG
jgi:hypothetical protein